MALGTKNANPATWLTISAKTGEMTAWDKTAQAEVAYSYVAGKVTGLDVSEKKWASGEVSFQLNVRMVDPESKDRYVVNMGVGSRMAARFLGQLNNADLARPLYIAPYFIAEGAEMNDGSKAIMDAALTSVKYVEGVAEDGRLLLSDGIKPSYGEEYGDKLPQSKPILNAQGKPLQQGGRDLYDHSEREELTAQLVELVAEKLRHPVQGEGYAEEDETRTVEQMRG